MGKLSDILRDGAGDRLREAWAGTQAAEDFGPLPAGEYVAHVIGGELIAGRTNGTPGFKLKFKVLEGEYAGRLVWHDVWLTLPAMPMAKRDLGKLGIVTLDQLERPLPPGIRCRIKVALRKDDEGVEYNRIRRLDVIGIDAPEADAFAPVDDAERDSVEPAGGADTSFEPKTFDSQPQSELFETSREGQAL